MMIDYLGQLGRYRRAVRLCRLHSFRCSSQRFRNGKPIGEGHGLPLHILHHQLVHRSHQHVRPLQTDAFQSVAAASRRGRSQRKTRALSIEESVFHAAARRLPRRPGALSQRCIDGSETGQKSLRTVQESQRQTNQTHSIISES